ncbi:uncharacterized protein MONBRDRAFT_28991 [Monosiga brevicollis MX1]|uniref:Mitochondrial carrier protein n=1 Tax=Monosiga brevicollis TaxID=81824 RepID=A9V9S5_MONBE|nr:uncharacterized protein MONBRDRAFT_28991 [Monosiga brevicollis MX1]EDQ85718.1 predicted protein [Monosiga brevicollis MX1]|eukprot:XP_001749433.1 hypothetical protein [Monosiga brevicollis MX1]
MAAAAALPMQGAAPTSHGLQGSGGESGGSGGNRPSGQPPSSGPSSPTTPPAAARYNLTYTERLMSSGTGAFLTSAMMTPFDVIKTRLQAQNQPRFQNCVREAYCGMVESGPPCPTCGRPRLHLTGTVDAFYQIFRHEGAAALWRGMAPTMIMSVPSTVIYFSTYDVLRDSAPIKDWTYGAGVAGATSRVFAASIISPLELVRTKMQAATYNSYRELMQVVQTAVKLGGVRVLWRGLGPTLLRDVPFSALYWFGYERLRETLGRHQFGPHFRADTSPLWIAFTAGALSGTVAAAITLPFDVIKTRQQTLLGELVSQLGRGSNAAASLRKGRETAWYIIRDVLRTHGYRGLWAGLTPRIAKTAPACAIMISTYEYSKRIFMQPPLQDQ